MPAQSKIQMLEKVNKSLADSKGVFVIDYRGLSVKETQELRRQLREAKAEMKVYKNNIVRIALKQSGMPSIDEFNEGTCAYVFYEDDPVQAAKAIKETSKKLNKIEFRGGISDGKVVSAEDVQAIADLPSHDELIAKLLGTLSNPLNGVVRVINGPAQGLVTALKAVADQKDAA